MKTLKNSDYLHRIIDEMIFDIYKDSKDVLQTSSTKEYKAIEDEIVNEYKRRNEFKSKINKMSYENILEYILNPTRSL